MTTIAPEQQDVKIVHNVFEEAMFPYEEPKDDDPDRRTHIVNPPMNLHIWKPGMRAQDIVDTARLLGEVVQALCGYVFVPKHNPEKFDACEACLQVAGALMRGNGE